MSRTACTRSALSVGILLEATVGALFCSLILGWLTDSNFSLRFTWPDYGWLVALALLNYVLGRLLITDALLHLRAVETSAFLLLQAVLTVLWAFLIFGERRAAPPLRGGALVLVGVGAFNLEIALARRMRQASVGRYVEVRKEAWHARVDVARLSWTTRAQASGAFSAVLKRTWPIASVRTAPP